MQNHPLQHKKILITRPETDDETWLRELENFGAFPISVPLIKIEFFDSEEISSTLQNLIKFNWIIFTSANSVKSVFHQFKKSNLSFDVFNEIKIAVVGDATAQEIKNFGDFPISFQPKINTAKNLADEIPDIENAKIFFPRSNIAAPVLKQILENRNAVVYDLITYKTIPHIENRSNLLNELQNGVDIITFFSPSAADVYHSFTEKSGLTLPQIPIISIGPSTSAALVRLGYAVAAEANPHTSKGVSAELIKLFSK